MPVTDIRYPIIGYLNGVAVRLVPHEVVSLTSEMRTRSRCTSLLSPG
jgi:hypothetical protein